MKCPGLGGVLLALVCCFGGPAPQQARAGLIPSGVTRSVGPEIGGLSYRFSYSIQLTDGSTLNPGDYFTVYDFYGVVADSPVAPEGWTAQISKTGRTPSGATPLDDPVVENVTFTYGGLARITANSGSVPVGDFSMASFYNGTAITSFASESHRSSDQGAESDSFDVVGAIYLEGTPSPEPGTGLLTLLGVSTVLCRKLSRIGRSRLGL